MWKAFALPEEREESVALLSYQHQGEFDYLVYIEPGYLFGLPAEALPSGGEEEAFRARKKYKNVVVDVAELLQTKPEEAIVPVGPLDELVKAADSLLKPVLHQVEADRHTYCVIDGLTRYEYISEL